MIKYWKVFCMEDKYPGLWRNWRDANCVALGWGPDYGFYLDGTGEAWGETEIPRKRLLDVIVGDGVLVHLPGLRVARIGSVLDIRVQDREWSPLVAPSSEHKHGEFGRRISVRWDPEVGPPDPGQVVQLQDNIFGGAFAQSIAPLNHDIFTRLVEAMKDPGNWVNL